ncbi:MAG: pseudaminic acid cytidylyltransferase [Pontimonas sp.]
MNAGTTVIIPARGGSSRIPGKNIRDFNSHPMIHWPITAALGSRGVDSVVVSTDSEEIAGIARQAGASVPFMRPSRLADAHAGTAPVVVHALEEMAIADDAMVACVYPTAAVTAAIIDEAIALSVSHPEDFVITVGRHRSPWERSLTQDATGMMALENAVALHARTQDLPQRFFDAGKIYVAHAHTWRERDTMMAAAFVPLLVPDWASVDMDEPEDWPIAEALHRAFVLTVR